jgi:hypothetical protein
MHEVVAQLFGQRIWQGGRRFSDDECFFVSYPYFLSSRPLKIQLCPPLCICFRFDPHSFDFYFFILMLLEVFVFFNFIPPHLI